MKTAEQFWKDANMDINKGWNKLHPAIIMVMKAYAKAACEEQRVKCANRIDLTTSRTTEETKELIQALKQIIIDCPNPKF